MAIEADQETEDAIAELVRRGVYSSAEQFLRESVEHALLRVAVAAGTAQLERGEGIPSDQAFSEVRDWTQKYRTTK